MNILKRSILILLILIINFNISIADAANFGTLPINYAARITFKNGLIWVTQDEDNLTYFWNGSSWIPANSSLTGRGPNDYINDIFIDNQNRLWFSGEYNSDDDAHTTGYFQMNSAGKCVSYYGYEIFTKGKNGTIWTYGYPDRDYWKYPTVGYFNGEGFTHLPVLAPFRLVGHSLTIDNNGTPWISGENGQVAYWNGSSWVRNDPPFKYTPIIHCLATASDGSIIAIARDYNYSAWAVYKNGTWTVKQEANDQISAEPIHGYSTVEYGPDGKVWGFSSDGIKYYENGTWNKIIPAPFSLADFTVDDSGILWAVGDGTKVAAYIEGGWFTDTDSFSSKLIEAAKKSADKAALEAQQAKTSADASKASADTASSKAQTAINQTWYTGAYGGNSESVANIAGYIRNTQLPGLETKINNLQVAINNIQNSDILNPIVDIQTVSGARATSGSSIEAIITVTDNRPGPFTYSINGGAYNTLPSNGRIFLPVSGPGNNTITVSVKDVAGNTGSKSIVIRKL